MTELSRVGQNSIHVSQYALAKGLGVRPRRINEIGPGKRAACADAAPWLGRYFGMESGSG